MKNWLCALGFYAFAGCGTSGLLEQKSRTLVETSGFSGEGVDFEEDSIIAAIDARIIKDISPWGFLGAVLHTFKTKKVS